MYKFFFKRLLDFLIALILLILIGWFIALIALFLHFANHGAGAFFTQKRPGKNGRLFRIIKFKTMSDERDDRGVLFPDEQRLTRIGSFIRSMSIDELPQLINVLKGDMSFIGPRPLTTDYLLVFTPEQARRHEVRPGISGWAQVHGRNLCKLSDKFKMDVWYVDHCTFATDCKIFILTVWAVLSCKDIGVGTGNMVEIDDLGIMEKLRQME